MHMPPKKANRFNILNNPLHYNSVFTKSPNSSIHATNPAILANAINQDLRLLQPISGLTALGLQPRVHQQGYKYLQP